MKSILIIGMGRFGVNLAKKLSVLGNEVMVVDEDEENIEELLPYVTSAQIGDCTKETVLKSLGVDKFDICFVCMGTNFQNSLEITSLLKENGAKYVVAKATRDIQEKFLLRNGADEVVYPERDMAENIAIRCSAKNAYDYIGIGDDYAIYEIPVAKEWVGKSIIELNFRQTYNVNIMSIKSEGKQEFMPPANRVFQEGEHLLIIGENSSMTKILKQ